MTKAYAEKKAKPQPPSAEAIKTAARLDIVLELRPLKPPGIPLCRICWDRGCRACGKEGNAPPMYHRADDSHLWQKGDR